MDNQLSDVTVHIDEDLDAARRSQVEQALRGLDGVVSVSNPDRTPHLLIVQFNPDKVGSSSLLSAVTSQGVHAELVGL